MVNDRSKGLIKIRSLPPERWAEYKELRLEALRKEPQAFSSNYQRESAYPDDKWTQRLSDSGKGKSWLLFAQDASNKLVGMIGGYRDEKDLESKSVQIYGVYVDAKMRGKGIGKALMSGMLEIFRGTPDIRKVFLEVNTDQESAKKLYEHFGFREIETSTLILGDGKEHTVSKMVLFQNH